MTEAIVVADLFGGPPRHIAGVPDAVLWQWRWEYREVADDRFGRAVLWEPFVREKLAAYHAEATHA